VSRVDGRAGAPASATNQVETALEMPRRFDMDGDPVGPRVEVLRQRRLGILDHQVDVERQPRRLPQRGNHRGSHRQVRDEVPVHDVDMKEVRATLFRELDGLVARAKSAASSDGAIRTVIGHADPRPRCRAGPQPARVPSVTGCRGRPRDGVGRDPFVGLEPRAADPESRRFESSPHLLGVLAD
jgi:hypothetical protein